jgi:predicted double-glycine peptidase
MRYILISLVETAGVILLAGLGVALGRWFSQLRSRAWLVGYVVPLLLVGIMATYRQGLWVAPIPPFSWILSDRVEFAAFAPICATLLTTLICQTQRRGQRLAVALLLLVSIGCFSVLPFLMPAFEYARLSRLETTIDNGVCLQGTGFTCGPAAAVTVLRKMGIPAEEGELAIRAHSNRFAGTSMDSLCAAIRSAYHVPCRTVFCRTVAELRGKEPVVAVMKYGFMVDHYVAVLSVTEDEVILGNPLSGLQKCSHEDFEKEWRNWAILIEKDPTRPVQGTR